MLLDFVCDPSNLAEPQAALDSKMAYELTKEEGEENKIRIRKADGDWYQR